MQQARGKVSLYAEYLKERTDDGIVETDEGFATYRYLDNGHTVYIIDIYVVPEARKKGVASQLADKIMGIAKEEKGCTCMLGTVQTSAKGSTISLKALLGYGMELHAVNGDAIILKKDI